MSLYTMRHGRRYFRDPTLPYPLPCDLTELHRQNLRCMLLTSLFGVPFCSPLVAQSPPRRVLEIACGTGLWSSVCHEYFKHLGHTNISFTGLDIAPLAPDLNQQGVNWRFVQHDIRKLPLPFEDDEFDMVFVMDISLVAPMTGIQEHFVDEQIRVLKPGGILETWESDHILRTLLPNPPDAPNISEDGQRQADATATYTTFSGTPFVVAQNTYIRDYNTWIQKILDRRKLSAVPCTFIGPMLLQETNELVEIGSRRIAIPLGEVRWEREGVGGWQAGTNTRTTPEDVTQLSSTANASDIWTDTRVLTSDQAALRRTALLTFVQTIESLEPLLKEASGKLQVEWDRWWANMMTDLLNQKGTSNGECLEVGAWWARKL
ncbi:MAG: hypothetical protein M1827_000936 [Pycnora praestabilis]|nr:MAG: hypothetical protein M1827_000936 [Pycnora praestabilis]